MKPLVQAYCPSQWFRPIVHAHSSDIRFRLMVHTQGLDLACERRALISTFCDVPLTCTRTNMNLQSMQQRVMRSKQVTNDSSYARLENPQRDYTVRCQSNVWRGCTPPPLVRGEVTLAVWRGGGGSIVRKTPDIELASYSIIPLRAFQSSI
jgi:hypothetical protein